MCCVHVHGSLSCVEWVFLTEYLYFEIEYMLYYLHSLLLVIILLLLLCCELFCE